MKTSTGHFKTIFALFSTLLFHLLYINLNVSPHKKYNSHNQGVLPPGIDDDIVFGIMWIRVGVYKPLKPAATASHKVSIQFLGEANPAELYTSQNNPQTQ